MKAKNTVISLKGLQLIVKYSMDVFRAAMQRTSCKNENTVVESQYAWFCYI